MVKLFDSLGCLAGDMFSVIYSFAPFADKIFSPVPNRCLYSHCLNMNLMTFNLCGGTSYFVDALCFDTDLQKKIYSLVKCVLHCRFWLLLVVVLFYPSQESDVFGSLSPRAQALPEGKCLKQLPNLRVGFNSRNIPRK